MEIFLVVEVGVADVVGMGDVEVGTCQWEWGMEGGSLIDGKGEGFLEVGGFQEG